MSASGRIVTETRSGLRQLPGHGKIGRSLLVHRRTEDQARANIKRLLKLRGPQNRSGMTAANIHANDAAAQLEAFSARIEICLEVISIKGPRRSRPVHRSKRCHMSDTLPQGREKAGYEMSPADGRYRTLCRRTAAPCDWCACCPTYRLIACGFRWTCWLMVGDRLAKKS